MKNIILILMLTVFGFSCTSLKTNDFNIKKNYSLENVNSLSISTKYAQVEVLSTDSKDVILEVTSSKEVKFISKNQSDTLYLTVLSSKVNSTSFLGRLFGYDIETSIIVKIPKDFNKDLDLNALNRNISISNLTLNLNVNSVNSDIDISNITGNSNLKSSNGDITVINNTGNIVSNTSNSNITVSNIDGFVDLETSNGSILLKNTSSITNLETSNGNITVNSDTLSKNGNIETSNGDLDLNINKLEGNNEISTFNGHITLTTKKGELSLNSYFKEIIQDISKNITIEGRNIDIITKK